MSKLKIPKSKLKKQMYNLIMDNYAKDIKLLLFKIGQSIPTLYRNMTPVMEQNKVFISQSTFKNMLMDSNTQSYNWEKRLKVINLIFEYLDSGKINAAYEGVRLMRDKKIRSIMELLKSDYKDKKEYLPEEVFIHEMENLPKDMKTYWESWEKD
jgi:hypothetical protein